MDELFIYDKDNGLFKKILEKSFVIEGRYHISPNNGQDLNSNNFDTLIADLPEKKYPLCVCVTPRSQLMRANGHQKEEFYFTLLFLCETYNPKNGINERTRKPTHEVWYDWKDMKEVGANFIDTLEKITRTKKLPDGNLLCTQFHIQPESVIVRRLSRFNEDRVSGVAFSFSGNMFGVSCDIKDYTDADIETFELPPLEVHQIHKHG